MRVHERSPVVRGTGTGIFLKNNFVEVLEEARMFDDLSRLAFSLDTSTLLDNQGNLLQTRPMIGSARMYCTTRQTLYQSFYESALRAGVEVTLGSEAVAADPTGALVTADGRHWPADLVVAADGVNSRVRGSLGIAFAVTELPTVITRYVLKTREISAAPTMFEHWSGRYRVSTAPCAGDLTWACRIYPDWDQTASKVPTDVEHWTSAFPHLRRLFELMAEDPGVSSHYTVVRCASWHKGRVAILGDAAHGLPPTLGQGAGLTVMNARALVASLANDVSVEVALPRWEHAVRSVTVITQRWAIRYDFVTRRWPRALWALRPAVIWAIAQPRVLRRMLIADRGLSATKIGPLPTLDS